MEVSKDMEGRVAVVTGAAAGIGRESARLFAARGARVVVADISDDGGEETVNLITDAGGTARYLRTDVTQEADVARMVAFARSEFGGLDFAHNNAGGMPGSTGAPSVADTDVEHWTQIIALNLTSVFLCLKHELIAMKTGGGAIVNTASAAAYRASRAPASYVTAKHGLVGLTKRAALEVARDGIRVNAVAPGTVGTEAVFARIGAAEMATRGETMPMGRLLEPEEIARVAVWLCSSAASAITGTVLSADGGLVAE